MNDGSELLAILIVVGFTVIATYSITWMVFLNRFYKPEVMRLFKDIVMLQKENIELDKENRSLKLAVNNANLKHH